VSKSVVSYFYINFLRDLQINMLNIQFH